jgi:hypothetical protein
VHRNVGPILIIIGVVAFVTGVVLMFTGWAWGLLVALLGATCVTSGWIAVKRR